MESSGVRLYYEWARQELADNDDLFWSLLPFCVAVLARMSGVLTFEEPGRWKVLAIVTVTLWGVRLAYYCNNWVGFVNLGFWLLIYNSIQDVEEDGHDHGHGHEHED